MTRPRDWDRGRGSIRFVFDVERLIDTGNVVVMQGHYVAKGKGTGKSVRAAVAHVLEISDGKTVLEPPCYPTATPSVPTAHHHCYLRRAAENPLTFRAMARLIVSMNLSLDGYIEAQGADDGSWLSIDEEVHVAFNQLAAAASTFLYGRKVYEAMPPYWSDVATDTTKPQYEREYGSIWVEKPKLVVSTSLQESRWSTRVVGTEVVAEVERLKRESSSYVLCYGGAQLVSTLESSGLVDEYALFVHPFALGAGVPFFRERTSLKLTDLRRFQNGSLCLRYARRELPAER